MEYNPNEIIKELFKDKEQEGIFVLRYKTNNKQYYRYEVVYLINYELFRIDDEIKCITDEFISKCDQIFYEFLFIAPSDIKFSDELFETIKQDRKIAFEKAKELVENGNL